MEVSLAEVVARLALPGACACQAWTGLSTCSCADNEPLHTQVEAKTVARVENLAQVLYKKDQRRLYLVDRPQVAWAEATNKVQQRWRHAARLMLMRNGVL